jgi:hypothetical protein
MIVSHLYMYVGSPWEGKGHVMKIDDNEISLEMRSNVVPTNIAGLLIYINTLIHTSIYLFIYLHSSTTLSTHHTYMHTYIYMYT